MTLRDAIDIDDRRAAVEFRLASGDPFLAAGEGKSYDLAIEERLARPAPRTSQVTVLDTAPGT